MSFATRFRAIYSSRYRFARACRLAAILIALVALANCRLYEPERYARLQFTPTDKPIRVLMIGNSLTYYNDLPGLLQQLSARETSPIYIEKITTPYASLKYHWDMDNSRKHIAEGAAGGHWDYVVLQEFSRMPVTDAEESTAYFTRFNETVTRAGAKSIIFENWTRRGLDQEYTQLFDAYKKILAATQGQFAPIGAAFREAAAKRPDIDLLIDDRHPTDAGTYLTAAVLYNVIYHKKSADLPTDLQGPALPASVIQSLRQIADDTVAGMTLH